MDFIVTLRFGYDGPSNCASTIKINNAENGLRVLFATLCSLPSAAASAWICLQALLASLGTKQLPHWQPKPRPKSLPRSVACLSQWLIVDQMQTICFSLRLQIGLPAKNYLPCAPAKKMFAGEWNFCLFACSRGITTYNILPISLEYSLNGRYDSIIDLCIKIRGCK